VILWWWDLVAAGMTSAGMGDGDGDGDGERLRACSCRDGQRNGDGRLVTEELRVPARSSVMLDSDRKILLDGFDLTCCNVLKLPLLLLLASIKLDSNRQRAFLTVSGLGNSSSSTSRLVGMILLGDGVLSSATSFSSLAMIS
jgi:hypothetical protein